MTKIVDAYVNNPVKNGILPIIGLRATISRDGIKVQSIDGSVLPNTGVVGFTVNSEEIGEILKRGNGLRECITTLLG